MIITGLPTLELEADSENRQYVYVIITSCKRCGHRGISPASIVDDDDDDDG